jgi:hypothetical protein
MTALTNSSSTSNVNDEYISQTDQAEMARMASMAPGLGEPLYTDPEHEAVLADFGIGIDIDDHRR